MAKNKTNATDASVDAYLAGVAGEDQRRDCLALVELMSRVTNEAPKMWGPTIVGFGRYHYRYESGREGDSALTGFAVRKNEIVVYLVASAADQETLLARLGRHRMGKSCLYIRRLGELDTQVLEQLVAGSVAEVKRRYG